MIYEKFKECIDNLITMHNKNLEDLHVYLKTNNYFSRNGE